MADRRKFEEIVADIRTGRLDPEEGADELEQSYGKTALREQAEKVPELERMLAEANDKAARLERVPARDEAFRQYGVDLEGLRPAERRAIEQYDGELEKDKIAEFVEEFDLPLVTGSEQQQTEAPPPAAGVVRTARTAPAGRQVAGLQITPDDARGWSATQTLEFSREHPSEWQALLQGQTVTGIQGPVAQGSPVATADMKRGSEGVRT